MGQWEEGEIKGKKCVQHFIHLSPLIISVWLCVLRCVFITFGSCTLIRQRFTFDLF